MFLSIFAWSATELARSTAKEWRDGKRERQMDNIWHPVGPEEMTNQSKHDDFSSVSYRPILALLLDWELQGYRDPSTLPRAGHVVGTQ